MSGNQRTAISPKQGDLQAASLAMEEEYMAVKRLKRLSIGNSLMFDPDLPLVEGLDSSLDNDHSARLSFNDTRSSLSHSSSSYGHDDDLDVASISHSTTTGGHDSDGDGDDYLDYDDQEFIDIDPDSSLTDSDIWVPANAHPKLAPENFRRHVEQQVLEIQNKSKLQRAGSVRSSLGRERKLNDTSSNDANQVQVSSAKRSSSISSAKSYIDAVDGLETPDDSPNNWNRKPSLRELTFQLENLSHMAGLDNNDITSLARTLSTRSIGITNVEKQAFSESSLDQIRRRPRNPSVNGNIPRNRDSLILTDGNNEPQFDSQHKHVYKDIQKIHNNVLNNKRNAGPSSSFKPSSKLPDIPQSPNTSSPGTIPQRSPTSPQVGHKSLTSPQGHQQRSPSSPQLQQRSPSSPQLQQRSPSSPQLQHRSPSSPQLNERVQTSPYHRSPSSPQLIQGQSPNQRYPQQQQQQHYYQQQQFQYNNMNYQQNGYHYQSQQQQPHSRQINNGYPVQKQQYGDDHNSSRQHRHHKQQYHQQSHHKHRQHQQQPRNNGYNQMPQKQQMNYYQQYPQQQPQQQPHQHQQRHHHQKQQQKPQQQQQLYGNVSQSKPMPRQRAKKQYLPPIQTSARQPPSQLSTTSPINNNFSESSSTKDSPVTPVTPINPLVVDNEEAIEDVTNDVKKLSSANETGTEPVEQQSFVPAIVAKHVTLPVPGPESPIKVNKQRDVKSKERKTSFTSFFKFKSRNSSAVSGSSDAIDSGIESPPLSNGSDQIFDSQKSVSAKTTNSSIGTTSTGSNFKSLFSSKKSKNVEQEKEVEISSPSVPTFGLRKKSSMDNLLRSKKVAQTVPSEETEIVNQKTTLNIDASSIQKEIVKHSKLHPSRDQTVHAYPLSPSAMTPSSSKSDDEDMEVEEEEEEEVRDINDNNAIGNEIAVAGEHYQDQKTQSNDNLPKLEKMNSIESEKAVIETADYGNDDETNDVENNDEEMEIPLGITYEPIEGEEIDIEGYEDEKPVNSKRDEIIITNTTIATNANDTTEITDDEPNKEMLRQALLDTIKSQKITKPNQPLEMRDSAFGFPLPPVSLSTIYMIDHRLPVHVERAIYRLSHLKLADSKRQLRQQVLLSNFMYSYLNLVNHTLWIQKQQDGDISIN